MKMRKLLYVHKKAMIKLLSFNLINLVQIFKRCEKSKE